MRNYPYQTRNADDVLLYIIRYKQSHDGNSPSVREIGRACRITSTSHVFYYLVKLELSGKIRLRGTRSIEVIGGKWILRGDARD